MRAVYFEKIEENLETIFGGSIAHHFINVLRLQKNEKILGLDGKGNIYNLVISNIKKKEITFSLESEEKKIRKNSIDIILGKVKKEAMELALRQCCELGVSHVFVVESSFSQRYPLNDSRLKKVLVSGIEQSNNPFLPSFSESTLLDVKYEDYENVLYFSSTYKEGGSLKLQEGRTLLIIGAEGGFSSDEEDFFLSMEKTSILNLDTSIMRSPTALSVGVGFYFGAMSKKFAPL